MMDPAHGRGFVTWPPSGAKKLTSIHDTDKMK